MRLREQQIRGTWNIILEILENYRFNNDNFEL